MQNQNSNNTKKVYLNNNNNHVRVAKSPSPDRFISRGKGRQLMRYWKLAGIDVNTLLAPFYDSEKLPCKDKREGSRILNELRTKWL